VSESRSDRAWVIAPAWHVYLGGYRMHTSISASWHYLAAGSSVERVGAVFKEMSRRRRARRDDWYFDEARRLFEIRGEEIYLKEEYYRRPTTSLLDEGDVALVFASRRDMTKMGFALDTDRLHAVGELLPRLRPTRPASDIAERLELVELLNALRGHGLIAEVPHERQSAADDDHVLTLTGHGGMLVATPAARVLIDPLLTLRYRPEIDLLHALDRPLDAVVITQARWTHFGLDTLIHVDRSTPIYLPRQTHPSSLDNIDMYALLRELGFHTLRPLTMWQPESIGDVQITALPFHGAGLGSDSPVDWMTVHLSAGGRRAYLATNGCADQAGSVDDVIREMVRRFGPIDVLFASYEDYWYPVSWFTRRPFYLGPGREQGSTSPTDAVRWMSLSGARYLVPYASFAWSDRDLASAPHGKVLYGGVVQRGALAQLVAELASWPAETLLPLLPGDALRWRCGDDLLVARSEPSRAAESR
jgi:L-ascorbate metabolism protein UlaG (beta-lactamase superfamily)